MLNFGFLRFATGYRKKINGKIVFLSLVVFSWNVKAVDQYILSVKNIDIGDTEKGKKICFTCKKCVAITVLASPKENYPIGQTFHKQNFRNQPKIMTEVGEILIQGD